MTTGDKTSPGIVLLVDDEPDNLEVFRFNFDADFVVHTAASGDEALVFLDSTPVEVVVADQRMPGMTGLDLLEEVRDRRPNVGRLLLTAHTNESLLVDAVNRQVLHRFLSKPWKYDSMLATLEDAVARYRLTVLAESLSRKVEEAGHMAMLGELSSALVHDLSQPLQVVDSGLFTAHEVLAGDLSDPEDLEDLRGAVADARDGVDHLRDLSTTMRGLMRNNPARFELLSLLDVLRSAAKLVALHARGCGVSVSVEAGGDAPPVRGDRVQLLQVITNLATNACDAMEGHPVRRLVMAAVPDTGRGQAIEIRDTGPGIPTDVRERIFEPFFTTKAEGRGTGLGLAIVRRITKAHGATLDVHDRPDGGTVFRVVFPAIS